MKTRTIEGLPVVDARRPLTITIKHQDVTKYGVKDPTCCAVARACKRKLHAEARVVLSKVYIKKGGRWLRYQIPPSIRSEIIAFDRGGTFEAGTYTISPVPPSAKLGLRRSTGPKKSRGKKRKSYHTVVNVRATGKKLYDNANA